MTRAELHDELRDIRETLKHVATKADVERMGRIMLMWVVGVMVALVAAAKWL